ncbi:Factor of DNA methylation 5 [Forsythia ovata]|uniref:Factor of DNA methylation 5 n=1 Tax=Forsythia ovata TaxID=205694 RepID=A0ABD1P6K7_9LAMI
MRQEKVQFSCGRFKDHCILEETISKTKIGIYKVKGRNSIIRCPFCTGEGKKQSYKYKELLQHLTGVSKGASHRRAKQNVDHIALAKYLENELADEDEPLP